MSLNSPWRELADPTRYLYRIEERAGEGGLPKLTSKASLYVERLRGGLAVPDDGSTSVMGSMLDCRKTFAWSGPSSALTHARGGYGGGMTRTTIRTDISS